MTRSPVLNFVLSLILLASMPLQARSEEDENSRWYEFEAIIFERIAPGAGSTEAWPEIQSGPSTVNSISLRMSSANSAGPTAYTQLPATEWKLLDLDRRLKNSRNYRPLMHLAWRQPIAEPEYAQPIYVETNQDGERLEGTLKIGVKRYLHLDVNLLLQRPSQQGGFKSYRMQTRRKMRSGVLHYLDHPVLGVLFMASRYAPDAPAAVEPPPAAPVASPESPSENPQKPL